MSLLGSLHLGASALTAMQVGLQVVGNNLANAGTEGYIRQELVLAPAPPHKLGQVVLGLGVQVEGVVQQIDRFLAERLRSADSDLQSGEIQEEVYRDLESIIGELGSNDLSTSLTSFFGALNDVLNQPEDAALRNIASLQGEALADEIRRIDNQTSRLYEDVDQQIASIADDVNRLVDRIAVLNVQIVRIEGGQTINSDAVGLRDERQLALNELAKLVDITTSEQEFGAVTVYAGGDFLVFEGVSRDVEAVPSSAIGRPATELRVVSSGALIGGDGARLGGLTTARNEILGGYLNQLDQFAATLANEFNRIHASGQGLSGFQEVTSTATITDTGLALDQDQLPFAPENGSFQIQVYNQGSDSFETNDIFIQLNGLSDDTTFSALANSIDQVDGISASIGTDGRLSISSDSPAIEFTFANDTSGVLGALGINTFFQGDSASSISINEVLKADPTKLATSLGGIGADAEIATQLAGLLDTPLDSLGGISLSDSYDTLVESVTQGAAVTRSITAGFRSFQQSLEGQHLAISGVNIDEEAVRMISLQRSFQAAARYINTVNELLADLVRL